MGRRGIRFAAVVAAVAIAAQVGVPDRARGTVAGPEREPDLAPAALACGLAGVSIVLPPPASRASRRWRGLAAIGLGSLAMSLVVAESGGSRGSEEPWDRAAVLTGAAAVVLGVSFTHREIRPRSIGVAATCSRDVGPSLALRVRF